jgi:hypothetical protein
MEAWFVCAWQGVPSPSYLSGCGRGRKKILRCFVLVGVIPGMGLFLILGMNLFHLDLRSDEK